LEACINREADRTSTHLRGQYSGLELGNLKVTQQCVQIREGRVGYGKKILDL